MEEISKAKFISTYLDSPIIRNERDRFLTTLLQIRAEEKVETHPSTKRKIIQILSIIGGDDVAALDPEMYPSFDIELRPDDKEEELLYAHRMSNIVVEQASTGMRKWGSPSGLGVDLFDISTLDPIALIWYKKMRCVEHIVQSIAATRAVGNTGLCQSRNGNLYYIGDEYFGAIKLDHLSTWYIVSFSQLLMWKDLYYSRFNGIIAIWQIYRSVELVDAFKDCLVWFFKCIGTYGNRGYEVAKSIEALTKANLIRHSDPVLGQDGTYEDQLEGMVTKERKLGKEDKFLAYELDLILKRDLRLPELVELFGIQKLSGHPLIDPEVGGESVRTEAQKKIMYSYTKVRRLRNNCCRLYVEGYIRKEHQWPPLVFNAESKRTKLYQLYSLGERKINRSSYSIDDWEGVRFSKHHDFDYYPNFTDLMDDKSISFYREDVAATWNSKLKPKSHQRLLLEMLSRPEISIFNIIESVRKGDIPYSWMIVSLYPKEREFKIAARMFSMMVFEMRAYFSATEANMADHIFPNLPQQTMTLTKQEIQELFHKVTDSSLHGDLERLYLEIDLTRWNLRWHPEVIDPIGSDLNDMFGLPGLYTAIHHFFSLCMIVVRVPACAPKDIDLPNPPTTNLCWYDHEVGFEGIGQKVWTFATYSMIDLGAGGIANTHYHIGQGDNQVILMSIDCTDVVDKRRYLQEVSTKATDQIRRECEYVGQEAREEECTKSTSVVTYSKDVYIHGVEYHTSVKALSRIFPHSSSDFPSMDGSIGSISSQCLSAAERIKQPMNAFCLWCFHVVLYLGRLKTDVYVEGCMLSSDRRETLTDRVIYGILILPSELGGSQIAPVTSFFYKGGADPLSKAYASLKFYQESSPLARKFIHAIKIGEWFEKKPDLSQLLDDPYGLPLVRPSTAENSISFASKNKVNGLSQNREIRDLTSFSVTQYADDLGKILLSCKPLNPILLSDIMGWSVVGAQNMISRMFTSTRTIQSLLQGDSDLQVCASILSTGTGHFLNSVARISQTVAGESSIVSIYDEVTQMRARWGSDSNIDITGVTSYTPFDLDLYITEEPYRGKAFKSMVEPMNGKPAFYSRGSEDPYIGRATQEKRSEHGYRIITSSAPERAVKRLADIATQPGVSQSFKNLISEVALSRTRVDLNEVYPLIGSAVGGTIGHRYSSRLGLRSANGLGTLSFASNCHLVNDDAYPISGGEHDVALMIQEVMVMEISLLVVNRFISQEGIYCSLGTSSIDWHFLPESNVEVTKSIDFDTPYLRGNALATVDTISIEKTHGPHLTAFLTALSDVESAGYHPLYAARRLIGRALEGSHSALAIADQGTGNIRLKFDLLEARGLGLRDLIKSAAFEISLTAAEAIFARSNRELRWTPAPMITTLAEACSRSLIDLFLHPMFKDDIYVIDLLRPSPLRYNFANQTPRRRLRNEIARTAIKHFMDPSSEIFTGKEIIFSDDKSSASSRLIVRRFKAILLQGILSGQCSSKTAMAIVKRNVPNVLRSEHTEAGKLSAFYRLCVLLSDWARDRNLLFLFEQFQSLYLGKRIYLCRTPASELIRKARSIAPSSSDVYQGGISLILDLKTWDTSGFSYTTEGAPSAFSAMRSKSLSNSSDYYEFTIRRLSGRHYGKESSAGYSYMSISGLAKDRICVVIGNGYGSGAATMINCGSPMVFGLDLWEDCSERSTMIGTRSPPAILHTRSSGKFVRIETSPRNRGDIRQPETAHLITRNTSEGSLYIIDVPIPSGADFERILSTCSLLPGISQVLLRLSCSLNAMSEAVCVLRESRLDPVCYPVFEYGGFVEAWIQILVPPVFTLRGVRIREHTVSVFQNPDLVHPTWLGGGYDDILQTIEGPYYGLDDLSLSDGALDARGLLEMSIGELSHRFTYNQWTEIIHTIVSREVLLSENPTNKIVEILSCDTINTRIGEHSIPVLVKGSLTSLLLNTVSRIT